MHRRARAGMLMHGARHACMHSEIIYCEKIYNYTRAVTIYIHVQSQMVLHGVTLYIPAY